MKQDDGLALSLRTSSMEQEFQLLSMSELRNGPGEILDRVADKGEAFIIERNGHRKACLVPLSVFFPDISPARIADELKEFKDLEDQEKGPSITITPNRELAFRFRHPLSGKAAHELTIVLPHGYPHRCPRVYVTPLEAGAPHRWADGALCIFGVMSVWNPGKHTVKSTLALAQRWLEHYEFWRKTDKWPTTGTSDDK